jgi:hypothetical protein
MLAFSTTSDAEMADAPTVGGTVGGITFGDLQIRKHSSLPSRALWVWHGISDGSPSAGTTVITRGGSDHWDRARAVIMECGSDAGTVLPVFLANGEAGSGANPSFSISPSGDADALIAFFAHDTTAGATWTPRTNWDELHEEASGAQNLQCQWKSDADDTAASATASNTTGAKLGMAFELQEVAAPPSGPSPALLYYY